MKNNIFRIFKKREIAANELANKFERWFTRISTPLAVSAFLSMTYKKKEEGRNRYECRLKKW